MTFVKMPMQLMDGGSRWQAGTLLTAGDERHQRGHSQRESATSLIITTTEYH